MGDASHPARCAPTHRSQTTSHGFASTNCANLGRLPADGGRAHRDECFHLTEQSARPRRLTVSHLASSRLIVERGLASSEADVPFVLADTAHQRHQPFSFSIGHGRAGLRWCLT
jgi:hypothetical protein